MAAAKTLREQAAVRVVGAPRMPFTDVYHRALRLPWWATLLVIVVSFLLLNALFAGGYMLTGGVANVHRASFVDAFFFSVQTMGTIGYGAMYPSTRPAQALVVAEAVVGMLVTALATGLVFAKFSRSTARIAFTTRAVVAPMDGVPTLMFRVGNERGNIIVEAQLRASLVRTERTREGMLFYRLYDLVLARDRSQAMSRSWTVMHPIVSASPLFGATPETIERDEVEIFVSVIGTDDTSLQPVHARHTYYGDEIIWGARLADVLSETPSGALVLDIGRFHDILPTEPTEAFPYPQQVTS